MNKNIQRNTRALETTASNYQNRLTQATNTKINNLINLYRDRTIAQFTTADNAIRNFITARTDKAKEKANREYQKIISKHRDKEPLNVRIDETKRKRTTGTNLYSISAMFFKIKLPKDTIKTAFKSPSGIPLIPVWFNPKTVNVKTTNFVENLVNRRIFEIGDKDKTLFKRVMRALKKDKTFAGDMGYIEDYIVAVQLKSADRVDGDTDFNPEAENLTNADNIGMYHYYMTTPLNAEYETFKEAIKVNHHIKNECWINTITDYYKDTLMSEKKREKNKLTREKILDIINMTDEDFKTKGASIQDMLKVFQHYKIQVRIYDAFEKLIFKHDPPKRDHHIPTLYAIVKNNHIYTVNDNLNSLKQTTENEDITINVSSNYYLNKREEPTECYMITTLDDIKTFNKKEEYNLIYEGNNLEKLFYESKQAGYEPQVKFNAGTISELNFKFLIKRNKMPPKAIQYKVKTQNLLTTSVDGTVSVRTEDIYNKMSKAMFHFNKALINPLHKSYYNEIDIEIFKECRTIAPTGYLNRYYYQYNPHTDKNDKKVILPDECLEIDIRKAYTHALTEIVKIPVFTQFDVWKHYDYKEHDFNKMNELTLYLVKSKSLDIFFNKTYVFIYGKFLKHLKKQCKIIYFKQPSRIYKTNYKAIIANLWKNEISDKYHEDAKLKKLIANVNIGLLEKSTNKSTRSYAFDSLREALYHQNAIGGTIYKLSQHYNEEEEINDENGELTEIKYIEKETDKKYYCLTVSKTAQLTNGYIYIKELLLQQHNFRMLNDYNKLIDNDINVYSVKTDAFVIRKEHLRKAKYHLEFNEHIGGWRHEKGKKIIYQTDPWTQKPNELIDIPIFNNETLEVKNEWNTEEIAKTIVEHNPLMIRSKYAGGGKSHIAKHFGKLGYMTLFVVPQNQLSQNIDDDATTTNKFFSIPVGDGEQLAYFDHTPYNVIVFDVLNKIREFVNNNPDKIIIGAGDVKQLPPIEDLTNTRKHDEYADECINQIFKYNIFLTICKRLGAKDDPKANKNRETLDNMYNDMWINKLDINDFVHKYFKTTNEITEKNIAYTNIRCLNVSNHVREQLGKKDKYEVGEILICRVYYKNSKGVKFNVNYRFKIVSIIKNEFMLENIKTKKQYHTYLNVIEKHFRYNYCATCHSSQGASINGKITIHEWDKTHLVSREWLWCALTRSTDFNNVMFFKGETNATLTKEALERYFTNKIKNYKIQDEKANREIDENKYLTIKWFMKRFKGNSCNCGCPYEFDYSNGWLMSNMTAQRRSNEDAHHKENCETWCKLCNCSAK